MLAFRPPAARTFRLPALAGGIERADTFPRRCSQQHRVGTRENRTLFGRPVRKGDASRKLQSIVHAKCVRINQPDRLL